MAKRSRPKDNLLSLHDAAEFAGVHYDTVGRWVRRRRDPLPAKMYPVHGRHKEWRIKKSDLIAFLEGKL